MTNGTTLLKGHAFYPSPLRFRRDAAMLSMTTLAETPEKSAVLSRSARIVILGLIHVVAIGVLLIYENGIVQIVAALLTWGLLNFFWLMLLRRPAVAALLSFGTVVALMSCTTYIGVTLGAALMGPVFAGPGFRAVGAITAASALAGAVTFAAGQRSKRRHPR